MKMRMVLVAVAMAMLSGCLMFYTGSEEGPFGVVAVREEPGRPKEMILQAGGRANWYVVFGPDGGGRIHMASAAGLLHADFRIPGDEYALLFRLTDALTHDQSAKAELFRRACLNVVAHNRDDHLKNFSFLMDEKGRWSLAPFYDFTYAEGPNGWQTLSVSGEGANPGVDDLRRLAKDVGLDRDESEPILERVIETCRNNARVIGGTKK